MDDETADRKQSLMHYVIRHVAALTPAARTNLAQATSGQRRYGRNAAIAYVSSLLLAQTVTRQLVAQTLKAV
jgi:hypothetical protein